MTNSNSYNIFKNIGKFFLQLTLFQALLSFTIKPTSSSKLISIEQKTIRYITEIDSSHIQAFSTKLIWSGYRQNLLDVLAAEEVKKAKRENRKANDITDASIQEFKSVYHEPGRKILAGMMSDVLIDTIIRSLVERMNVMDAKFVMKYKDVWEDSKKPHCDVILQKNANENGVEEKEAERGEKIECYLDFMSIQNILGLSLSFTLSMQSKLAPEMEQHKIDEMLEQKKVPQLVNKSIISVKIVLSIPTDFDAMNGNDSEESTMTRTQRVFFDKANQLFVVTKPTKTNIGKSKFIGLEVLEDFEKESYYQNYIPPVITHGNTSIEDDMLEDYDGTGRSTSYKSNDNKEEYIFDEEKFYNGLSEDEARYQEEEMLRSEEEDLYESINELDYYDEDDVGLGGDDEYENIENFMKQVEEEIAFEDRQLHEEL